MNQINSSQNDTQNNHSITTTNQGQNNSISINILPPEIMANIFQFCNIRSLAAALLVNKEWKLISEEEINFRFPNKGSTDYIKALADCFQFKTARKKIIEQGLCRERYQGFKIFDQRFFDTALMLNSFPLILSNPKACEHAQKDYCFENKYIKNLDNLYNVFLSNLENNLDCLRYCLAHKYINYDPKTPEWTKYFKKTLLPIIKKACECKHYDVAVKIYKILVEMGYSDKDRNELLIHKLVEGQCPIEEIETVIIDLSKNDLNINNRLYLLFYLAKYLIYKYKELSYDMMNKVIPILFRTGMRYLLNDSDLLEYSQLRDSILDCLFRTLLKDDEINYKLLQTCNKLPDDALYKLTEKLAKERLLEKAKIIVDFIKNDVIKKVTEGIIDQETNNLVSEMNEHTKIIQQIEKAEIDSIKKTHLESYFSKFIQDTYENNSDQIPSTAEEWFENFTIELTEKNESDLLSFFVELAFQEGSRKELISLIEKKEQETLDGFDIYEDSASENEENIEGLDSSEEYDSGFENYFSE